MKWSNINMKILLSLVILCWVFALSSCSTNNSIVELGDTPVKCTSSNAGNCECGDTSKGFTTYTFKLDGTQRCFTIFRPKGHDNVKIPVVFSPNCYAHDRLIGIDMTNDRTPENAAATRFGYVRVGVSTPEGEWTFGNDNVINDAHPMPCSDEDSKDIAYMRKIFDFLDAHPQQYDTSKIYSVGFSQNSMWSSYTAYCFADRGVLGYWGGGSGMSLHGQPPYLPGCQGQVTNTDFVKCKNSHIPCPRCLEEHPCKDCQYWPIYPCYSSKRPMVACIHEYTNDPISTFREDPDKYSSATYMYDRATTEGHDARLFRFSPSQDGTIKGGHSDPKNVDYWRAGCLGITGGCGVKCQTAFIDCVENSDVSSADARTKSWMQCMEESRFTKLDGCTAKCTPTFNMLTTSEKPTTHHFKHFGKGTGTPEPRSADSKCTMSNQFWNN